MKKNIVLILAIAMLALQVAFVSAALENTASVHVSIVNQDPDPARSGDIVEVRLGIENEGGGAVTDLATEFVPSYPFTLVSGEEAVQNVGTLQGYQGSEYDSQSMKIIKYRILVDKDAIAGSYDLKVKVNYAESLSPVTKGVSVAVESKQNAEIIHIDKSLLVPGEQSSLKFSINNVGSSPLRDLSFYWENSDGIILPVGSDNTRYVKYIDVGDSAELEYQVIADTNADAGLYKLDLHLTYDNPLTNGTKTISTIAGVYVGGGTDFDVAFSESSSSQVSFTVANIGSNTASSVSVIIPQQDGWQVTGASSMIIGNLNVGDYTVASFTIQSVQSNSGSFNSSTQNQRVNRSQNAQFTTGANTRASNKLKIQIAYTDTMGLRKFVDKEVTLNQASSGTSSTANTVTAAGMPQFGRSRQQNFFVQYKWYIITFVGLGAVALLIVFRVRYKKEKLLNPNFKVKDLFRKKISTASGKKK
jgi:hypothetical protein